MATECFLFGGFVIITTAIWVYVLRERPFEFLAYAMFLPGATALVWSFFKGTLREFVWMTSGLDQPVSSIVYSIVSMVMVVALVQMCVKVSSHIGWAQKVEMRASAIHGHNRNYVSGFMRAAGEEVGWRCFLLPCLVQRYSTNQAILICGVFWGLFHVPVMVLLMSLTKPQRPRTTAIVQCVSCVFAAFTHGWVAIKSGYSMWPASVMHWFWNVYNPTVLGSIYTNTPGHYTGEQWKINGEGLMGCLVMAPVVAIICIEQNNWTL
ncbi:uncharacterized protein LOC127844584 [Dreissena polymorpha]|uniref:CAAX prenyl protease 2/Lysostaphin resistance protein A-like domain-containing protein n=1 Tax=Dreissena polymorpha TaxID=45954 RepID=A0A9D4EI83_DREPO|nr:uncharacterized protein LOC127844089 [Dreissena polymorpha]XP_052230023.1 uncharacterized protein LOC127844089 [Dreissena polymorpha]XP_052230024.1 uncharacterized protein LOC127844089 [Dreissena polymorpha]XP_052230025.1 uncharacterized protein LOC127844089 [Dreissena polymorpha]XP_052230912.1 uncharacterized protein LOC127844584 [Dreissena polymorpha]XP_052230913.1 uncharacterized protein LOC127844584 [Dreissena polymorpha]XP_052230914.1 uncharacterized protein LOC127844584 [Dreissena po